MTLTPVRDNDTAGDRLANLIRADLVREFRAALAELTEAEARFAYAEAALLEHDERRTETEHPFAACDRLESIYQRHVP